MSAAAAPPVNGANSTFKDKEKPAEVRRSNITAGRSVADAIRTSLGPKGMDKMVKTKNGEVLISNDGHTILREMALLHPAARMLVELSGAQDAEAGDGTTSVVILAGALLGAGEKLLDRGIHPSLIAESFTRAAERAVKVMLDMSIKIDLTSSQPLIQAATTSLSSKIVSQYSNKLAPMCVDAVLQVANGRNVDLNNIRLVKKLGGTIEDTELINGMVLHQRVVGQVKRVEKAKIALVQFQLSPPKPDLENHVVVSDYRQMDKILKEERQYLLNIAKTIKKYKCNVVLIQKSILRDAINEMALHFMNKLGIMVVKDIERDEVEFISKTVGCHPIADIDSFAEDKLGSADLIEEVEQAEASILKVTGLKPVPLPAANKGGDSNGNGSAGESDNGAPLLKREKHAPTCSIVCRGVNTLVLDETERSIHDALCVIKCLVKQQALIAGGGAAEIEVSRVLNTEADTLGGTEAVCWKEFAEALEVIPTTLAENAGVNAINAVTELRQKHAAGAHNAGISMKKGTADITTENVLQPVLVNTSAVTLAAECVKSILRIDDIQFTR